MWSFTFLPGSGVDLSFPGQLKELSDPGPSSVAEEWVLLPVSLDNGVFMEV